MKLVKTIILVIAASGFFSTAVAQVSATMEVRVEIISSAAMQAEGAESSFDQSPVSGQKIRAGSLILMSPKGSFTDVLLMETPRLVNASGDIMEFEDVNFTSFEREADGYKELFFDGILKNDVQANGHYQGQLKASVVYL